MTNALPAGETFAHLVDILPDYSVEEVWIDYNGGRFDEATDPEACYSAVDQLLQDTLEAAYGDGSTPPLSVQSDDRLLVKVDMEALDRADYEDAQDYKDAKAERAEEKVEVKAALTALVKAVIAAVLAADPVAEAEEEDDEWEEEEDTSRPATAQEMAEAAEDAAFNAAYDATLAAGGTEAQADAAGQAALAAHVSGVQATEAGRLSREDGTVPALHLWRLVQARADRSGPEGVMPASTLSMVHRARPATLDALALVPGMTPRLVKLYGQGILAALAEDAAAQPAPDRRGGDSEWMSKSYMADALSKGDLVFLSVLRGATTALSAPVLGEGGKPTLTGRKVNQGYHARHVSDAHASGVARVTQVTAYKVRAVRVGDAEAAAHLAAWVAANPATQPAPEAQAEAVIRITHAAAVGALEAHLAGPGWASEALYHDSEGEDGTLETLLRVGTDEAGLVGSITVTTGPSGVSVEVSDLDGASEVYPTIGDACQRLDALRWPAPDMDALAAAMKEAGFRLVSEDDHGNLEFGRDGEAETVWAWEAHGDYYAGVRDDVGVTAYHRGSGVGAAVEEAMRAPEEAHMRRLRAAMERAGFDHDGADRDDATVYVSACPVHEVSESLDSPLTVRWETTGYQLGAKDRGRRLEGTSRDLTLEQAVDRATAIHDREHATRLAKALLSSLILDEATCRGSDMFAWQGEVRVYSAEEQVRLTVTSSVRHGVSIVIALQRRGGLPVEQILPGIRTTEDWEAAVQNVQEQVDDMAEGGVFA